MSSVVYGWVLSLAVLFGGFPIYAEQASVAVAANFKQVASQLSIEFKRQHPQHRLILISGSSGKLLAQIRQDAPFDVFLSADHYKTKHLVRLGMAVEESEFTYALGQLLLVGRNTDKTNAITALDRLKKGLFRRIAIANPRVAPYGLAASQVVTSIVGTRIDSSTKIVMAENIAMTLHYLSSSNVDLALVAASFEDFLSEHQKKLLWRVPPNMHQPIKQNAVLLTRAKNNSAAKDFLDFLRSSAAQNIVTANNYLLANANEP